jgi:MFS family permease
MSLLRRLLLISFLESFATVCVERGIYFFGTERLQFSDQTNLWLALGFGLAYMSGAMLSHRFARRLREKPQIVIALWAQVLAHLGLAVLWRRPEFIFIGNMTLGFLNGAKWPVIESYIGAGRGTADTARAVGLFNIAWAGAVPLALIFAGPVIGSNYPQLLFVAPAVVNVISLFLVRPLSISPAHMPPDHPERPSEPMMFRLRNLLTGSQLLLLCSFASMWVLAALMPDIFTVRLAQDIQWSTGLSSLVDMVRFGAFVLLFLYSGWHFRLRYLALSMVGLPVGFFMVLYGPNLSVVLSGEAVFGLAAGLVYFSAMYYAMVVHNAAVEAGGMNEGIIGTGFAIGPAAGLIGLALQHALGGRQVGMLLGLGPILLICTLVAASKLAKARERGEE